jgi:hypothetical protein
MEVRVSLLMVVFVGVVLEPHVGVSVVLPVTHWFDADELHEGVQLDLVESVCEFLANIEERIV